MSEAREERNVNPNNEERRSLRKQLRKAGWNVGGMTKTGDGVELELWPVPHTGPSDGVEALRVRGADKTDAMRNAVDSGAFPTPVAAEAS